MTDSQPVYIGQFPDTSGATRAQVTGRCTAKRHNGSSCDRAHTGGTHSLGPEWGEPSKYTERKEVKGR